MITFLFNALKIIVMLGFLVLIHEGGHFCIAKLFKIKVNEFAIGFGPTIFTKEKGETKYALRLIPLGGFVSMEGEEERSENEGSFSKASIPKRMMIVAAGAIVNILFGLFTYFVLVSAMGNFYSTTVDHIIEDYAAQYAGIEPGDTIIKINDQHVKSRNDVTKMLQQTKGDTIQLTLLREEKQMNISLTPTAIHNEEASQTIYYLGIVFKKMENSFWGNIYYGLKDTVDFSLSILENLKSLLTEGFAPDKMVGIVGISDIVVNTNGIIEYIYMIALISLSLGVTNLLPIPPLDGGKILIYFIEAIRKKPMKEETELNIQTLGFSILIALSIYVTYHDILRIF